MCSYEKNSVSAVIIDLIVFIIGISQLVIASIFCANEFNSQLYLQYNHIWWKKPYFTITKVPADGTCPDEKELLVFDYFTANRGGCDCTSITSSTIDKQYRDTIVKKSCTSKMTGVGCKNISGNDIKSITNWKGVQLCVESRKPDEEYYDYLQNSVSSSDSCKRGYKACGLLDKLNQKMCIRDSRDCPINDIIINTEFSYLNYDTISLTSPYFLHHTNKATDKPVIWSFKLSEGLPCAYEREYNSKTPKYPLTMYNGDYGCKLSIGTMTNDNNYKEVDKQKRRQVFTDNGIMSSIDQLRGYPTQSLDEDLILYKEEFIGFNKTCIIDKKINPYTLWKYYDEVSERKSFIVAILVFIVLCLLIFIWNSIYKILYNYKIEPCMNCIDFFYSVSHFISVSLASRAIVKFDGKWKLDLSCGNDWAKEILKQSFKHYERDRNIMVAILVLGILPLLIYLANFIIVSLIQKCCFAKESRIERPVVISQTYQNHVPPIVNNIADNNDKNNEEIEKIKKESENQQLTPINHPIEINDIVVNKIKDKEHDD